MSEGLCRISDPVRGHWSGSGHASWHARMHAYRKVRSSRPDSECGMPFTSRLPLRFLQCSAAGAALQNDEKDRNNSFERCRSKKNIHFGAASAEKQGYWNSHTFCPTESGPDPVLG